MGRKSSKTVSDPAIKTLVPSDGVVVVTRNLGLTVAQAASLRSRMREAGASYKASGSQFSATDLEGFVYSPIGEMLAGPTAVATSADPIAAAKVAVEFADTTDRFEIVGGAMGSRVLDEAAVRALARLPSLDASRSIIIGQLKARAAQAAASSEQILQKCLTTEVNAEDDAATALAPIKKADEYPAKLAAGLLLGAIFISFAEILLGWLVPVVVSSSAFAEPIQAAWATISILLLAGAFFCINVSARRC